MIIEYNMILIIMIVKAVIKKISVKCDSGIPVIIIFSSVFLFPW